MKRWLFRIFGIETSLCSTIFRMKKYNVILLLNWSVNWKDVSIQFKYWRSTGSTSQLAHWRNIKTSDTVELKDTNKMAHYNMIRVTIVTIKHPSAHISWNVLFYLSAIPSSSSCYPHSHYFFFLFCFIKKMAPKKSENLEGINAERYL